MEPRRETVGKRTLVEQVYGAAEHGVSGSSAELPHVAAIQRSFGRHDVGHVRAHVGGRAAEGATAMGADAFAFGNRVAFAGAPDLHTAAHEAAHVVQQRGGVQLKGGVGQAGDAYEQHADAVADLVVQGRSAEALLDQHAGGPGGGSAGSPAIQRHVFVGSTQLPATDPLATGKIGDMVKDDLIRDYETQEELQSHAGGQTDYVGNLVGGPADGTWLRFSPRGTNVLGERHTEVVLDPVVAAVGSRSFIHERFAAHDIIKGGNLEQTYNTENQSRFESFGIQDEPDKKQFGAEALLPKFGFVLMGSLPYFAGQASLEDLRSPNYVGKPYQRYLKMAWAHAKDISVIAMVTVLALREKAQPVPPKLVELFGVVGKTMELLDAFMAGLSVDGYLGDAIVAWATPTGPSTGPSSSTGSKAKPRPDPSKLNPLLAALHGFARTYVDYLVEVAATPGASHLDDSGQKKFQQPTKDGEKATLFKDWRNHEFAKTLQAAVGNGVRYVGMGREHLKAMVQSGLPRGATAYDMVEADLATFKARTQQLRETIKK
ncbi:MAG TPA: DUF4157 domain-containing protein [Kofleriaceae bacterium]|nr:DUF4157 domain-containing protein [Kofleriaceae bacterium]